MKRFIKFIVIATVALSGSVWVTTSPTLAVDKQSQKQADACRQQFDGKTYADGDATLQKLIKNNDCFQRSGNCLAHSGDTSRTLTVQCTKKPGTNVEAFDQAEQDSANAQNEADGATGTSGYTDEAVNSSACNKNNCDIIDNFINPLIKVLSIIVGLAAVVGIVLGAIQVSTSAGDPQKAANGKNHIRNALIALVAYVLLFLVLKWLIPGGSI